MAQDANVNNLAAIAKLFDEIEHLKRARELLSQVWLELGPYNMDSLSYVLQGRLQNYFEFDDSE